MSKYRFKPEERWAIWIAYDKKCFYCEEPLDYRRLTIDHLLPESLLDNPPKLAHVKAKFGLGDGFSINDYCNWVPACGRPCNLRKRDNVLDPSPQFLTFLQLVSNKAEKAREEEKKIKKKLDDGKLFSKYEIAYRNGQLSEEEWRAKIDYDYQQKRNELESIGHEIQEAARQNDAIRFLRLQRQLEHEKAQLDAEKDEALYYVERVFFEEQAS